MTSATLLLVASLLLVSGCGEASPSPKHDGGGGPVPAADEAKSAAAVCARSFNEDLGTTDRIPPTMTRQAWDELFLRGVGPIDEAEMVVDGGDCVMHVHIGGGAGGAVDQYFVGTSEGDWRFRAHLAPDINNSATATALSLDEKGFIAVDGAAAPARLPESQARGTSTGQGADETYGEWCEREPAACAEGEAGVADPAPTTDSSGQSDSAFGFRAPSKNIYCNYTDDALTCVVMSLTDERGQVAWSMPADGPATRKRVGGNIGTDVPELGYGARWSHHGFVCTSEQAGVTCTNGDGDGFALSRDQQRIIAPTP